jgi:cytochrome oxidase assembly protein ShyY1
VRSLSFLVSRRWILFALVVVLLGWLAWFLGEWQFHRLEDRKERNEVVERNVDAEPVPVTEVLAVGEPVASGEVWRRVTATGEYDVSDTVIVRYRTRDGASGVDVVVPLVTREGPVLLVDRGWLATGNSGARPDDVPPPPSGEVSVTGWVRQDASGRSTEVTDHSTRSISSREIAEALDLTAYGGFVDLESESPEAADPLEPAELPDLGSGPHFFYGLQWWFFGLLAIFGFFYLAYDEWRGKRASSESPEHASVDGEHGAGDE